MFRFLVLFCCCWLLNALPAQARRVALVIGNAAYAHTEVLRNARNDAADMAAALSQLGFLVISRFDVDKIGLERARREFAEALTNSELALFYYAGHGLQVTGQNYLVPTDAKLLTPQSISSEMIEIDKFLEVMEAATNIRIVFLDACRNNPLARNLRRALKTRSAAVGQGLASTSAGVNTLISFATGPNSVAFDGTGANSPFTAALKLRILEPNKDLLSILAQVRKDVVGSTSGQQVPWEHSSLLDPVYLRGPSRLGKSTAETLAPKPPTQLSTTANCVVIGRDLAGRIEIAVGSRFCDAEGRNHARVTRIADRAVVFEDGGAEKTCLEGELCGFDWPVNPMFRVTARSDPARSIAPRAAMMPR